MTEYEGSTEVVVNFDSETDVDKQESIKQSIEALRDRAHQLNSVRRATDMAVARATARPAERRTVEIVADEALIKEANDALVLEQTTFLDAMTLDVTRPSNGQVPNLGGVFANAASGGVEVFAIPFHYDWRWAVGSVVIDNTPDRPTGRIRASAWGRRRCDAHAGFGVTVHSDRDHWMTARSLRRSSESCRVKSGATGAVALSEGGTEMTVMEGSTLLQVGQDKRFRVRKNPGFWSDPEEGSYDSGGFGVGNPIELTWFGLAGHNYQVNAGAWAFAEWTSGPHASGDISSASGGIVADVLAITVFHQ
jgi:hypothetical protein